MPSHSVEVGVTAAAGGLSSSSSCERKVRHLRFAARTGLPGVEACSKMETKFLTLLALEAEEETLELELELVRSLLELLTGTDVDGGAGMAEEEEETEGWVENAS